VLPILFWSNVPEKLGVSHLGQHLNRPALSLWPGFGHAEREPGALKSETIAISGAFQLSTKVGRQWNAECSIL